MSGEKISQLSDAGEIFASDNIPILRGGNNYRGQLPQNLGTTSNVTFGSVAATYFKSAASASIISGAVSYNGTSGTFKNFILNGDTTLTIATAGIGSGYNLPFVLFIEQDGTGGHALTFAGSITWVQGGVAPTMPQAANANLWVTFYSINGLSYGIYSNTAPFGTMAYQNADAVAITGGSALGLTDLTADSGAITDFIANSFYGGKNTEDISGAYSLVSNSYMVQELTLTGDTTVTVDNTGAVLGADTQLFNSILFKQDGTGSHALVFTNVIWPQDIPPTMPQAPDAILRVWLETTINGDLTTSVYGYYQEYLSNNVKTTNYTLTLADNGRALIFDNPAAMVATLEDISANLNWVGFRCSYSVINEAAVTFQKTGAIRLLSSTDNYTMQPGAGGTIEACKDAAGNYFWQITGGTAIELDSVKLLIAGINVNDTYPLISDASTAGNIIAGIQNAAGTVAGDYTIDIDGTPVTGLTSVTNTMATTRTVATGANAFVVGSTVSLTTASLGVLTSNFNIELPIWRYINV